MFAHLHDIVEASFSIYYVFVGVGILTQFCVLVRRRHAVQELIGAIERFANRRESIGGGLMMWCY